MNLLVPFKDPYLCAQAIDNTRIVKLAVEAQQMLSYASGQLFGGDYGPCDLPEMHHRHPVTLWVCANENNWLWALHHAKALIIECDKASYKIDKLVVNQQELTDIGTHYCTASHAKLQQIKHQNSAANGALSLTFKHWTDTNAAYRAYMCCRWLFDLRDVREGRRGKRVPTWRKEQPAFIAAENPTLFKLLNQSV